MATPGLFTPVSMNGHVLVDGGTVNPVPYDLLLDHCDITIAIDVMGSISAESSTTRSLPLRPWFFLYAASRLNGAPTNFTSATILSPFAVSANIRG